MRLAAVVAAAPAVSAMRFAMYFDEWHKTTPPGRNMTAGVNYVITAFAPSATFNTNSTYTPFMPLDQIRAMFDPGAKVCMAIGGWGDTAGFGIASATEQSRMAFAENVANAVHTLGYDCVDVDWEYPGGNGHDYQRVPNDQKTAEIEAYPLLLAEIKAAIGNKELSVAVPGKEVDMIAFTAEQVPKIDEAVDCVRVMAYDLMNRRDYATNHHSSVEGARKAVEAYIARGMTPSKLDLGFAFYAKYFVTRVACDWPTGCPTAELEGFDGSDTQQSGAVTFEAANFNGGEFERVLANGRADDLQGGQWWWDPSTSKFWTWDTPAFIARKFAEIVRPHGLGGVFAWSLAQDSHDWSHFRAMQAAVRAM